MANGYSSQDWNKILLHNIQQQKHVRATNPNYTHKPPIGHSGAVTSRSTYTQPPCRDLDWKPSSKRVEPPTPAAKQYIFKPSCRLVSSKPVDNKLFGHQQSTSNQVKRVRTAPGDSLRVVGTDRKFEKPSTAADMRQTGIRTQPMTERKKSQVEGLLQYKYGLPFRDDLKDKVKNKHAKSEKYPYILFQ